MADTQLLGCVKEVLGCVKEVGICLWPHIKRHLGYWWSFEDNIRGLKRETAGLEKERFHMDQEIVHSWIRADDVTLEVGNCSNECTQKLEEVRDWSNECTQKLEEARRTLESGAELGHGNIISRYQRGKSAKKIALGIAKLRRQRKYGYLSTMRPSINYLSHNCIWRLIDFSREGARFPVGSNFPNLRLLVLHQFSPHGGQSSQVFDANVISFEGMKELIMLLFSYIDLPSLPPTLPTLTNLTTLRLEYSSMEDISVVGELASLEFLYIHRCHSIEELPADIRRLNQLKILELDRCIGLKRVAEGVISSLVQLEKLKIIWSPMGNGGNRSGETNACLSELSSLPMLTYFKIETAPLSSVL